MTTTAGKGAGVGTARWSRIIPVAIIVYIISFMDRTNIGFAFTGLGHDLHLSASQQGLAGGIFFIGYLFLQIPGGHLAERWSAKKFVGIMILVWGVFAVLSGLVQTYGELLVVRFLLGVAEGGIWPAILVLISHWFPAQERARAYGVWMMNIAISSIITAPLSGWILSWSDWRMLFFVEGVFPFVIAAPLWWWLVADRPSDARWVSPAERDWIETSLARENADAPRALGFSHVFRSSVVWRLVVVYFLIQVGFYGLNLWLPHLVKTTTGGSSVQVGLLTAIPYLVAIVALYLNAHAADRTGRYAFHVMMPMVVAAATLVASVALGGIVWLSILLVSIAMAGALAYDGPFWASASRAMPVALAGGAMGLINALGNLGGFLGPYLGGVLQDASGGSFLSTSIVLAVALLLAGLVMLTVRGRANPRKQVPATDATRAARR
ncbi:MFS transporter [Pseudonocardia sp. RS11V-5]|uniref:MFS transporter n=1 Tax=Pseudonocardia terrae TaxID=2905831 RepID=UPI001E304296|nr:MFS transporter [Pseudonocardia terrae]MCE3555979.1 MFS transporter [Pseudonocardia terrae]